MRRAIAVDPKAKRRAIIFLAIAGALLWIPTSQLLVGRPPNFLRNLGFFSGPSGTPLAWALAIAAAVAYSAFTIRNIPLVRQYWRSLSFLKLFVIPIAAAAAIVEEALFRRVIMGWVLDAGGGAIVQVLATGMIFGLAHGIWGIATGRIIAGLGATIATGAVGVVLGIVYVVGERSLAPVIVSHFIIDAVIQPGIMFAAFSGQMPRPVAGWWRLTSR